MEEYLKLTWVQRKGWTSAASLGGPGTLTVANELRVSSSRHIRPEYSGV